MKTIQQQQKTYTVCWLYPVIKCKTLFFLELTYICFYIYTYCNPCGPIWPPLYTVPLTGFHFSLFSMVNASSHAERLGGRHYLAEIQGYAASQRLCFSRVRKALGCSEGRKVSKYPGLLCQTWGVQQSCQLPPTQKGWAGRNHRVFP